jgi:tricorn protease-like protein
MFPTCMKMVDMQKLKVDEESALKDMPISKGNFLVCLGTTEGKVLVYRIGSASHNRLLATKGGVSFGAITDIDVTNNGAELVAANQTGEMFTYDLLKKLNDEQN